MLIQALKLLHPYMPFITEEIFCTIQEDEESIMISDMAEILRRTGISRRRKMPVETIKEAVRAIRNVRTQHERAAQQKGCTYMWFPTTEKVREIFENGKNFLRSSGLRKCVS